MANHHPSKDEKQKLKEPLIESFKIVKNKFHNQKMKNFKTGF